MWDKITGHKRQIEQLRRAAMDGSAAHCYLFYGIDGIGKKLVALAMASELLEKEVTENSTHPDFIFIGPSAGREITIDTIRDLKDRLKFAPMMGKNRAIIIGDAELMNANSANAALKILEEPPAGNYFFLITVAPHQLLPTIVSRCQKIAFSPLTNSEIENYLVSNRNYTPEDAHLAAETGGGSIGRALAVSAELIGEVTSALEGLILNPSATKVIELGQKWSADSANIGDVLYILHRAFHSALTDGTSGTASLLSVRNSREKLLEKCRQINKLHAFTDRTYNKQLMFEQLLFNLAV